MRFTRDDIKTRNQLIKKCLETGMSKSKTAKIFGISRQWLYQILKEEESK